MRSAILSVLMLSLLFTTSCNNNNDYQLPDGITPRTIELESMEISISVPDSSRIITETSNYINIIYKGINLSILKNNTGASTTDKPSIAPAIIPHTFNTDDADDIKTQHNYFGKIQTKAIETTNRNVTTCYISSEDNTHCYIIYATSDPYDDNPKIIKHIINSINPINKQ